MNCSFFRILTASRGRRKLVEKFSVQVIRSGCASDAERRSISHPPFLVQCHDASAWAGPRLDDIAMGSADAPPACPAKQAGE